MRAHALLVTAMKYGEVGSITMNNYIAWKTYIMPNVWMAPYASTLRRNEASMGQIRKTNTIERQEEGGCLQKRRMRSPTCGARKH